METKISQQGNIIEVTEFENVNRTCHAYKIDADHWLDPETGEIREYEHKATSRANNAQELRATFARIRALVNANCVDPEKLRWITLTYKENMTDTVKLKRDFDAFMKRFRRRWGDCEFIAVVEPQARGAWHIHHIPIYEDKAPYIPNDELRECWGHGFVKVTALKGIDNVGAYLSAYLADAIVEDGEAGTVKVQRDGTSKRVLKGGRLHMYPKGMKICRHSRGVKQPDEFWCEGKENVQKAVELVRGATETYKREFKWVDEQGMEHSVLKRYFNLVREPEEGQKPSDCWLCWDDDEVKEE